MLAKDLAARLLQNPDNEVFVVFSQQEPTGDNQIEEPHVFDSLADRTYITGEPYIASCFVEEDNRWMEQETKPRRKEMRWVTKQVYEEVEI